MPADLSRMFAKHHVYPVSFSKYGNVYRKEVADFDYMDLMEHRLENWAAENRADIRIFMPVRQAVSAGGR